MIGPGPDGTNYLAAIDEWVESGEAPEQLPAPFRALLPGQPEGGEEFCALIPMWSPMTEAVTRATR